MSDIIDGPACEELVAVSPARRQARTRLAARMACVAVAAVMVLLALCGAGPNAMASMRAATTSGPSAPDSTPSWPAPTAGMLALRAANPAPGRLERLPDGRQLHMTVVGSGRPTVVMEAGAGDWSLTWCLVAPRVARGSSRVAGTRVVTYDRAGLGWSDPTGRPPTATGYVRDLHDGLKGAGIRPPYVLVGHSMGGVYARLYAHRYPLEVAGVVLVDPGDERLPVAVGAQSAAAIASGAAAMATLSAQKARQAATGAFVDDPSGLPTDPRWPAGTTAQYHALYAADPWVFQTIGLEAGAAVAIWREVAADRITSLGDIPLAVVRSSKRMGLSGVPALAAHEDRVWRRLQAAQARESSRGRLIIAPRSDHYVQLADPHLVTTEILRVVAKARVLAQ